MRVPSPLRSNITGMRSESFFLAVTISGRIEIKKKIERRIDKERKISVLVGRRTGENETGLWVWR